MGKNSIQSNLTKDDLIAEIRLTLGADFKREHTVIIVEGEDDISFLTESSLQMWTSVSLFRKRGVLEIVSLFSDSRVIGVCDVDYDTGTPSPQILYYDYSCLEMMLISSDSAFTPFFHTYYRGKAGFAEIRLKLLQELKWLSCYRKLNSIFGWAICFNGLSMKKAFETETQNINTAKIISQIRELNLSLTEHIRRQVDQVHIEYDKNTTFRSCCR